MGANISLPSGRGPYCFRIHGQLYRRSGALQPPDGTNRQYGQVYILEGDQTVQRRLQHPENQNCRPDIMRELQRIMNTVSRYAAAYKHMFQVEQEQQSSESNREANEANSVQMFFKRGSDKRRYNETRHDEVAAIFVGTDGASPFERDIVVYPRDARRTLISYMSANCDPMVYPILFPRGDLG